MNTGNEMVASFARANDSTKLTGEKIRAAREAAGLTQDALSRKLEITQTCVSYWEAGKRDMGVADLVRVADALGVHAASLLPVDPPSNLTSAIIRNEGRMARVEVKGFRDLGIVRVTETTLAGEAMLHAECEDGSSADFPASSLHFITWLPDGTPLTVRKPRALTGPPPGWRADWDSPEDSVWDNDPDTDRSPF